MRHGLFAVVLGVLAGLPSFGVHAATVPIYAKGNILAGANFNDGPGSSDMTLIMRLTSNSGKIYIDEGSPVKYMSDPDNKDVKPGWTKIEYDDSKWKDGESGVGFADNDDNTEIKAGSISCWTRYKAFDIADAATIKELKLLVDFDDHFAAWLNGVLIHTSNPNWSPLNGDEPKWDVSQAAGANKGSCELPKGKPNEARWKCGSILTIPMDFKYAGVNALAVDPKSKAAVTWGELKRP